MKKIRKTAVYRKWLRNLNDDKAVYRIRQRIKRLREGNPGDHRNFGDIAELRIDYGAGYRVYYKDTGKEIVVLLCGGDKTTQQGDIAKARKIIAEYMKE